MILIGIGSNLPSIAGSPIATCTKALVHLASLGVGVVARSPWYETAPVPVSDQPWFANGVAQVTTSLAPLALLDVLQAIEAEFGRVRTQKDAARTLDLDLLAYDDVISDNPRLILPHPRLHERAFVLWPLRDLAPDWRHPVLGLTAAEMADRLPSGQELRRFGGNP